MKLGALLFYWCFFAFVWGQSEIDERAIVNVQESLIRVVDKQGRPVVNLPQHAFSLYINGKKKPITTFEEVKLQGLKIGNNQINVENMDISAQNTGFFQPRTVLILIDSSTMSKQAFTKTMPQLAEFVKTELSKNTVVKVVQMEQFLKQVTTFSTDKEQHALAINSLKFKGRIRKRLRNIQVSVWDDLNDYAKTFEERYRRNVNRTVTEKAQLKKQHLKFLIDSMAALGQLLTNMEGNKSILLVTGGGYLDKDTTQMYYHMASSLAAQKIMVHSLLAKDPRFSTLLANNYDGIVTTIHDLKRMPFIGRRDGTRSPGDNFNSRNTIMENSIQMESGPYNVSDRTGGVFYKTKTYNTIGDGLKYINQQALHYYVLRYRSSEVEHKVKIKVKSIKENTLHYAKKIIPPIPYGKLKGDERELAFLTEVMYGKVVNDEFLACEWGFDVFGTEKEGFSLPIYGKIAFKAFPEEGFEIGIGLFNEKRHLLAMRHQVITKFSDPLEMPFYDVLNSKNLPYYIRCSIRDLDSGLINMEEFKVNGLVKNSSQTHLSSIVLSDKFTADYYPLDESLQTRLNHPLEISGKRIKPNISGHFKPDGQMVFYVQLQNCASAYLDYDFYASITKNEKVIHTPVDILYAGDIDHSNARFMGNIQNQRFGQRGISIVVNFC